MGRILLLLRAHPAGLTTDDLLERVGYGTASRASRLRSLNRDLAALAADGWRIDTQETANTPARRTLRTVDNRFATLFSPAQRTQLARAAQCAGEQVAEPLAGDLGRAPGTPVFVVVPGHGLDRLARCQSAAADRCLLRFTYNGTARVTHPYALLLRPGGWYLQASDEGDGVVKYFAVDRLSDVTRDAPGTAEGPPGPVPQPIWDFMRVPAHDPITVTVETTEEHMAEVLSALGTHGHEVVAAEDPRRVRLEVPVTNTQALVDRVLELGTRVWVLGPDQVRADLRDRLRTLAVSR
jgi:predicted DNA-binding transcriptional regulator YafY